MDGILLCLSCFADKTDGGDVLMTIQHALFLSDTGDPIGNENRTSHRIDTSTSGPDTLSRNAVRQRSMANVY